MRHFSKQQWPVRKHRPFLSLLRVSAIELEARYPRSDGQGIPASLESDLANNPPAGFFAYPANPPSIPATIAAAIEGINRTQRASITSWESLRVSGRSIVDDICAAIDKSSFVCADVTGINANVLFEIGYAIATDKRVWLIRDESYLDTKKEFDQLRVLTTVGFSPYTNSSDIIKTFFSDAPHEHQEETIWKESIEPVLAKQVASGKVLYLRHRHETEASLQVGRALENSRVDFLLADPDETSVRPAYWYAQHLWESPGLLAHFSSSAKEGFRLHNARYALVCGMARGFSANTLMLSEQDDLLAPMDYRDSLRFYRVPREAAALVDEWILPIRREEYILETVNATRAKSVRLATELKGFHLQLGDYIAEDESASLASYFVETTVSNDILNGTQNIFVGRKGTGKSANLIHAQDMLGRDSQNLVCLIKPVGYEIQGLVRLFASYRMQDYKGYVIESLWKYMLYTEIARAASDQIAQSELWRLTEPDAQELVSLMEDESKSFSGEFAVRLERIVGRLSTVTDSESGEKFREGISEALHSGALSRLRSILSRVLSRKRRVLLLVDNLDKSWNDRADLGQLADFLLGLLIATSRIGAELSRTSRDRDAVNFSSAVFLRSDIFEKVQAAALEKDKLSYARLSWDDNELLLRVIEERYVAAHGPDSDPATMWHKYFCPTVRQMPTREFIVQNILKRPRDIVYLVKAAVSKAVNRKHDRVEEKDILDAHEEYSQYAIDSILVENVSTIPELEDIIFRFSGSAAVVTDAEAKQLISGTGIAVERVDSVIQQLVRLTFLGYEVAQHTFVYADEMRELKRNAVLADRFATLSNREGRLEINPAFRSYLQIGSKQVL